MPLWDDEKQCVWMLPGYLDCVIQAGGLPLILPFDASPDVVLPAASICSGFLFTGGHSVAPLLYGASPRSEGDKHCPTRDLMERQVLESEVLGKGKPALGICRGLQVMNVVLGGSLYQELSVEYRAAPALAHYRPSGQGILTHHVELNGGNRFRMLFDSARFTVNSYHQQGVRELASSLEVLAWAVDGLVEAVSLPDHVFCLGVQWHPELMAVESHSRSLFQALVMQSQ
jgi:putative glutamine amidotransferase